jgi:hypothetical protein
LSLLPPFFPLFLREAQVFGFHILVQFMEVYVG